MRAASLEQHTSVRYHERMDETQPPYMPPPAPGTVQIPVRKPTDAPYAVIGLLSYLSILCIVPLFVCAPKTFERFHAMQGTLLFVTSLILGGVSLALPAAMGSVLLSSTYVLTVVEVIIGTRSVLNGIREPLPFFGTVTTSLNVA